MHSRFEMARIGDDPDLLSTFLLKSQYSRISNVSTTEKLQNDEACRPQSSR